VVGLRVGPIYYQGEKPDAHRIGSWVDPKTGKEEVVKRKIPAPNRNENLIPQPSSPYASHYTDQATQNTLEMKRKRKLR
jgi:hypothetical protein